MVVHIHDIACVPVVLQTLAAVDDTKRQVNASLAVSACEETNRAVNSSLSRQTLVLHDLLRFDSEAIDIDSVSRSEYDGWES